MYSFAFGYYSHQVMATYTNLVFFFVNDTATTEIYTRKDTLSLHDALPISCFRPPRVELPRRVCPESLSDGLDGDTLGAAVFDANPDCESGGKMSGMQWGRLQVDVNCQLRRGAWYRVKQLASLNAVLDVNRQLLAVPHYLIEVVSAPPRRWSVVPRPQNARVR